ncbi:MAG: exodeoxyribonuclease VII small subunit [Tannerella sp.]|jgi:exodeoxyribonuclease VII small subunit|nr:exodeoxyribonuclease VII small subunit [Tannerella sp.]
MEKKETYNEAITNLQEIYDDLEAGKIEVDVLSEKVQEAARLIKICKDKLYRVDEDVKKIMEEI